MYHQTRALSTLICFRLKTHLFLFILASTHWERFCPAKIASAFPSFSVDEKHLVNASFKCILSNVDIAQVWCVYECLYRYKVCELTCSQSLSCCDHLPPAIHWKVAFCPTFTSTFCSRRKCGVLPIKQNTYIFKNFYKAHRHWWLTILKD